MLVDITESNFEHEVLQSELPVALDFYAEWCAPCKEMEPVFDKLAQRFEGRVKFGRVDTGAEKALRIKFCVASLPTVSVVRGDRFIDVADGLLPADELASRIERVLTGELDDTLARRMR